MTQSNLIVRLQHWGMKSTSLLPSLLAPLRPGVVASNIVFICQICNQCIQQPQPIGQRGLSVFLADIKKFGELRFRVDLFFCI